MVADFLSRISYQPTTIHECHSLAQIHPAWFAEVIKSYDDDSLAKDQIPQMMISPAGYFIILILMALSDSKIESTLVARAY